ncbi:M1 family metallopeptidase [Arenibacter sp. GZD96]|uniref:M1 family metallopeptidase n=1 Tax=Aurantibrevibacter litoralis TaxID=3106030 RepID=UPI002AFDD1CD|nr:M1 family metallopeptidase [Arenibacter sp. GZD-96]MEA1785258.1 M1 family metallopeptidase [Arenibacter sp. GZD-96]
MKQLLQIFLAFYVLLMNAQKTPIVDFTHADAALTINPNTKEIGGRVTYTFHVSETIDTVFLDAKAHQFSEVTLNTKKVRFTNDGTKITVKYHFKKGRAYTLSLTYTVRPKQTVYFVGWDGNSQNKQIWTQGQGKYTSHWLPSFDDMTEKVEFDLSITFNKQYEVMANGALVSVQEKDSLKTWNFNMNKPMSSYLVAFAIGKYHKKELRSASGVPLALYYYPKDSVRIEPTYRYSKEIFDILETEIGVAYPWQNYKQIPVRDFLYAGMENTGNTIFSDAYVIDSVAFKDRNYININAHELAHQWFGNLVTEVDSAHHWLHEGFATYYALLAEKTLFGEPYFYWNLLESAQQLNELSRNGKGEALTDPKAGSLTFYQKGAWALFMLRQRVGEESFREGVKNYLVTHQFRNVTVSDFLEAVEAASGQDLSDFEALWLHNTTFPMGIAKSALSRASSEMADFFALQEEMITTTIDQENVVKKYWQKSNSPFFKKAVIALYNRYMGVNFIQEALRSDSWEIRQALAVHIRKIPDELQTEFASLLNDASYETIENALYRLWIQFPNHRNQYLDKTKGIEGFSNKNVRILWLSLAVLTNGYEVAKKPEYYAELAGYTAVDFGYEIRQTAFQYVHNAFEYTDQNLKDLINATAHHVWQFRKFARELLNELLENQDYRKRIQVLAQHLPVAETAYVFTKLGTK